MTRDELLQSPESVSARARERVKNTMTGVSADRSRIDSTVLPRS